MTDWHEFLTRNVPAAVGTAIYAFTQLGLVAWLTCAWILVQMARFCLDWYRSEKERRDQHRRQQEAEDLSEEGYP